MEAIFLFATLAGVIWVVWWMIVNDNAGNRGPTRGLFALRDPPKPKEPASDRAPRSERRPAKNRQI